MQTILSTIPRFISINHTFFDMALAIFDLDNTLLGGDSDYLWGEFLVEQGYVDSQHYQQTNRKFYEQYLAGTMDIHEFLAFQLQPLAEHPYTELVRWRDRYLQEKIDPVMLPAAQQLIAQHRQQQDTLLIITATNQFITAPIAEKLGIPYLIATEAEVQNGQFTGRVAGTPSYREGKVIRLNQWLDKHDLTLDNSYFYSDSHNDLPLLSQVTYPVAVDPDPILKKIAQQNSWKVISLRAYKGRE